jgi:hypothetical protein
VQKECGEKLPLFWATALLAFLTSFVIRAKYETTSVKKWSSRIFGVKA